MLALSSLFLVLDSDPGLWFDSGACFFYTKSQSMVSYEPYLVDVEKAAKKSVVFSF